ncbi:MAG: hypothetical protein GWN00_11865, partial [Aliifodinibius sp.]|nr:hypothetical protein [Fodinibius sp.]NIV14751.1 hypothetical protein [Fodinibius sp.]NIY25477.1 hypothetical protein [Fodinibius sp.]
GYAMEQNFIRELTPILNANQILVEHRYFGQSRPDSLDWQYLTVKQAAADHHGIVDLFKRIYKGTWVSTGISKGGQTALFHRRVYPNDVAATVAYVSPITLAFEDERLDEYLYRIGDSSCREKIKLFQRQLLKHKTELLPRLRNWGRDRGEKFSMGLEKAFEFAVLEYPFSFWQRGVVECSDIPSGKASAEEMFEHFQRVLLLDLYTDRGRQKYAPYFYQTATELGYYGYRTEYLNDLLTAIDNPSNLFFAPEDAQIEFNPKVMQDVLHWLQHSGNNIIYLYGGLDPWTGAAVEPSPETNAIKIVQPDAAHNLKIRDLSSARQQEIFTALEEWLNIEVEGNSNPVGGNIFDWNAVFIGGILLFTLLFALRKFKQLTIFR